MRKGSRSGLTHHSSCPWLVHVAGKACAPWRRQAPEANLRPQLERSEQERRRPRPREGPVESDQHYDHYGIMSVIMLLYVIATLLIEIIWKWMVSQCITCLYRAKPSHPNTWRLLCEAITRTSRVNKDSWSWNPTQTQRPNCFLLESSRVLKS